MMTATALPPTSSENLDLYEDQYEDNHDSQPLELGDYDLTAIPGDYNVATIVNFIDKGVMTIPGFQRNYVWDLRQASRLIESLIIGIPIPQIFLYAEGNNKYLVIDGQQRCMTIYFYLKGRFPKKEVRNELRKRLGNKMSISNELLKDDELFQDFSLDLKSNVKDSFPQAPSLNIINRINGKIFEALEEEDRTTLELRTIRTLAIRQNAPDDGNSVLFELFNRLNSGGSPLEPQEIRMALYDSLFYKALYEMNLNSDWRMLNLGNPPDLRLNDFQILLRAFALLQKADEYKAPMKQFLNRYSAQARSYKMEEIDQLRSLFVRFVEQAVKETPNLFIINGKFSSALFEAVFVAVLKPILNGKRQDMIRFNKTHIERILADTDFKDANLSATAEKRKIDKRIEVAEKVIYA